MFNELLRFESPRYLALLVLVPALWWASFRALAILGPVRRWVALGLRSLILVALILALAEMQLVRVHDRVAVLYLLDESLSIPDSRREAMRSWVNASIRRHRRDVDYAGVIVFGRDAAIEVPPFDDDVQLGPAIESTLDPRFTNLDAAIRLAVASFPPAVARRMVVISDGAENVGDAERAARHAAQAGVSIDVFPIRNEPRPDVRVERLVVPSDIRQNQPFDLRVVLDYQPGQQPNDAQPMRGRLVVSERTGNASRVISDEAVVLRPGKQVFVVRQQISQPAALTYAARFVPEEAARDGIPQNNRATTFAYVRGRPRVLLIESFDKPGQHALLVERLGRNDFEVDVRRSDQPFGNLAELQAYDTVVLANVPREHFSDRQLKALERNTHDLAGGLIMLGGENGFGAGGWTNTPIEKAMPVDFQIKAAKIAPNGALALILHACELPQGNHWQKIVAREAIRVLGANDYCGVLHWNMTDQWLWGGMRRVGAWRQKMLALIDRMQPSDMPEFGPTMRMALDAMRQLPQAAIKHMIIISDGDPAPPPDEVLQALTNAKVTVSTVAIGTHGPAGSQLMADIASRTGGKYYAVNRATALPRIFQREARRVARPLIYENPRGFAPRRHFPNELVAGLGDSLPPITGYVLTTVKQSPLVEVPLVAPMGAETGNNTILANWQYGAGRAVAFTSDSGARWTKTWDAWPGYDKLFAQMIRWSMRPSDSGANFQVTTQPRDGRVDVIVTAMDAQDQLLNFLLMRGTVIGPDMEPLSLELEQVAPGRYVGSFDADESGSYFLSLTPGSGKAPLRVGVNVPYSAEFRRRFTNRVLLGNLASLRPPRGQPGRLIEPTDEQSEEEAFLQLDPFRRDLAPAVDVRPVWPWAVFVAGVALFFDVLVRRVAFRVGWLVAVLRRLVERLRHRGHVPDDAAPHLDRLRQRKAEVDQRIEQRRATSRFEPSGTPEQPGSLEEERLVQTSASEPASPTASTKSPEQTAADTPTEAHPTAATPERTADEANESSYTERLLKAKKRVWEQRKPKR